MFDRPILLLNGRSASRLRQIVQYHKDAFVYIKVGSESTVATSKSEPVSFVCCQSTCWQIFAASDFASCVVLYVADMY